jgi:hypothetical protein
MFKFILTEAFDGIPAQTVGIALSAPRGSDPAMAQLIADGQAEPVLVPKKLLQPIQ